MRRSRSILLVVAVLALAATSLMAERMGNRPLSDPAVVLVMLGMAGSFLAALWLAGFFSRDKSQ